MTSLYWLIPSLSAAAVLIGLGAAYGGIKATLKSFEYRLERIEKVLYNGRNE